MKKKLVAAIFLLSLIAILGTLNAFEVYVRPPRIVARMNVTPGEISTYSGFLEVKNQNDFNVSVSLTPTGQLFDIMKFTENELQLRPGEARNANFTITVTQPLNYTGEVIVQYSAKDQVPVALQAEIFVITTEVPKEAKTNNKIPIYIALSVGFIVLVLLTFMIIKLKKGGSR